MIEEKIIRSTCGMCFSGCGVRVHIAEGKVVKVKGDPDSPINRGVLCPKGNASPEFLYHPDRLKRPLKQVGERIFRALRLGRIKSQHPHR
jgi:anaerobic selenocysteine-containing dehydrogenase